MSTEPTLDVIEDDTAPVEPEAASLATDSEPVEPPSDDKVFSAEYVTKLRQEAADARVKAKRADTLAAQLVKAWATVDGRLFDADDLAFSDDMLDDDGVIDQAKITAAIDELLTRKPHLARRKPTKPVPQGAVQEPEPVSLHAILRERA